MIGRRLNSNDSRRGMAVLMVILLLSITLGLSYAMVRFQNTAVQVEINMDRRESARHAAITGLTMALKKMQTSAWGGVNSTLSGSLSAYEQYSVTYTTGDATLTSASSDWSNYPYRVTLDSTGTAADPSDSRRVSTHKIRAVVRLVPRKLSEESTPSGWSSAVSNTLYQYRSGSFSVSVPFRASGNVRCSSRLSLASDYSWSDTIRERYLTDLERMRSGNPDWRPFGGTITLPYSSQQAGLVNLLSAASPAGMAIPTANASALTYSSFFGSAADTYRVYPGGQQYTAETLPRDCQDRSWAANPLTNPLGIFVHSGAVNLNNNASITGTIIARRSGSGDVFVRGTNVRLLPQNLPRLCLSSGESLDVRLPTAVVEDDFRVFAGSQGTLQGLLSIVDEFEVRSDTQTSINVSMQLRIIARDFLLRGRSDWDSKNSHWWDDRYDEFTHQGANPIAYFPAWLVAQTGLDYVPRLVIEPETTEYLYHWCNPQNGLYVADPSDGGLRWELVRWTDNP